MSFRPTDFSVISKKIICNFDVFLIKNYDGKLVKILIRVKKNLKFFAMFFSINIKFS